MTLEQLVRLNNQIIDLETLEEIEEMEEVECVESNGLSGRYVNSNWYTVWLNDSYINESCDDSKQIQVYI